eukprot:748013-Hanusia_phi.AAC.1
MFPLDEDDFIMKDPSTCPNSNWYEDYYSGADTSSPSECDGCTSPYDKLMLDSDTSGSGAPTSSTTLGSPPGLDASVYFEGRANSTVLGEKRKLTSFARFDTPTSLSIDPLNFFINGLPADAGRKRSRGEIAYWETVCMASA